MTLVSILPNEPSAFQSPMRVCAFDLPLKGELTGLTCPCQIDLVLHLQVEIDLAATSAWIRQAKAPTGGIPCRCEQGNLGKRLIPVKVPDNVMIDLVAVEDPGCNPQMQSVWHPSPSWPEGTSTSGRPTTR